MDNEHERRLTDVEARAKSNTHRLDELERRQDNLDALVSTVAVMANKQDRMENDVQEIKADVKSMAARPGKRWEAAVEKALWAVLAAVIAFMLGQIGLQ